MAAGESGSTPPRPVMAFQVGVTGHRSLPHADIQALHDAAAILFRSIRTEVLHLHAADQSGATPLYRAEPPELRCVCGLAEGADRILVDAALAEGWTLVAALPFTREEFEKDFEAGPPRDSYHAQLAKAAVVCELDGIRHRGGEPYAEVGQLIVEQADMMIVVWDGLPPRGPGGTGDVVQRALDRGVPVAVLPHAGSIAVSWLGAGKGDVAACVRNALLPAEDKSGFPRSYLKDAQEAGWARALVTWYERIVLAGIRIRSPAMPPAVPVVPKTEALLLPYFLPADRLARVYAARYRAAGLLRYGLILPATVGAFIASFGSPQLRGAGLLLQFTSLVAVLLFTTRGGWDKTQNRFVAYRALAEYLRNVRMLAPMAALPAPQRPPVHRATTPDWTEWYGRAAVRAGGLVSQRFDAEALSQVFQFLRAEASEQVSYLLDRAARYTALARRLHRIGVALFLGGIVFEIARAIQIATGAGQSILWFSELSLVLPALAPVFLGLLAFGEYQRLATRYRALAAELQTQLASLDRAAPHRANVLPIGRRIADVLMAEGTDWQLLIKARSLSSF